MVALACNEYLQCNLVEDLVRIVYEILYFCAMNTYLIVSLVTKSLGIMHTHFPISFISLSSYSFIHSIHTYSSFFVLLLLLTSIHSSHFYIY